MNTKQNKRDIIFSGPTEVTQHDQPDLLEHPYQWMQKFCKFAHLKPTYSILHSHFYKAPTSVCLLYTSVYLNNHYYYYFIIYLIFLKSLPHSHPKPPALTHAHTALAASTTPTTSTTALETTPTTPAS